MYKERYENFKRNVIIIIICLAFLCFLFKDYTRFPEFILQFVLAWFYLALTVREHILIRNGSKLVLYILLMCMRVCIRAYVCMRACVYVMFVFDL